MPEQQIKRGIFEISFYVFLLGVSIFLATASGFILKGFESNFFSNLIELSTYLGVLTIYLPFLILSLIILLYPIMNMIFIKVGSHPATQENLPWLVRMLSVSYLFNPEQSLLGFLSKGNPKIVRWSTNILRVLIISILVFLLYGIFQSFFPQLSVTGVPPTVQQVTPESDVVFGSVIPTFAEGGTLFFAFFFILGLLAVASFNLFRGNRNMQLIFFFTIAMLIICPLVSFGWMEYHSIAYANDEVSKFGTFIFALISTELTVLTGIFFWFYAFHLINNLVLKLLEIFSPDVVRFYMAGTFFVLLVIYITFEFYQRKKKRNPIVD